MTPAGSREHTVARADRADRAVATALAISRAAALTLIASGGVRVAGRRLRKGQRLESGSVLELREELDRPAVIAQPELPLAVLLESPAFVAVLKPAGIACHPLLPGERGTLANALVAQFPECLSAGASPREAGLCHRLDRETSGAILAARQPEAFRAIRGQFRQHHVEKIYLALVQGRPPRKAGSIELSLGGRGRLTKPWRSPRDGRQLPAVTLYRERWSDGASTLLEVSIVTGVRYQIRAHLAALGHPLRGDTPYGGEPFPELGRHLLHASRLAFRDPADGTSQVAQAPLPADARRALADLGAPHLD